MIEEVKRELWQAKIVLSGNCVKYNKYIAKHKIRDNAEARAEWAISCINKALKILKEEENDD